VFFGDHEVPDEPTELATDFGSFLEILRPYDIRSIQLKPDQVKSSPPRSFDASDGARRGFSRCLYYLRPALAVLRILPRLYGRRLGRRELTTHLSVYRLRRAEFEAKQQIRERERRPTFFPQFREHQQRLTVASGF
jgi:hypothetical protein